MDEKHSFYYEIVVLAALSIIIFSIQSLIKSVNYLEKKIDCTEGNNTEATRID